MEVDDILAEVSADRPAGELRLVLVGMTGSGKSSSGNTILGQKKFKAGCRGSSVTRCCQLESAELMLECSSPKSRKVSVLDTPGFDNTSLTEEEVKTEISKCVSLSAPGPHTFLLVVPVGRYTDHQNQAISAMAKIFGEEAVRHHTVVLFSRGDDLEDTSIETFLRLTAPDDLRDLVNRCGGRYHVFNNKETSSSKQVMKLLEKVDHIVGQRGFYTNSMFKEAEAIIREEEERLMKLQVKKRPCSTRARKGATVVTADNGRVAQKLRRERLAGGRGCGSSAEEGRFDVPQHYNRVPHQERSQNRMKAALSTTVLNKIKILVAAVAVGLVVGAAMGALVPLAVAGGSYLTGAAVGWAAGASVEAVVGTLVAATSVKTAVLLGAAGGGLVGGLVGFNAGAEAASPGEGAMAALTHVVPIGAAAVGVGAGVGCVMGVGAALGAAKTAAVVGVPGAGVGLINTTSQCSATVAQVLSGTTMATAKTCFAKLAEFTKGVITSLSESVTLKVQVKKEKPTEERPSETTSYKFSLDTKKL